MDWARVKNIMIVLLLGVNIFLLSMYIMQEHRYRSHELATRSDVCSILRDVGVEASDDAIPLDSVTIRPAAVLKSGESDGEIAAEILGDVTESVTESGVVYTSDSGNILFSQNTFSLVYASGRAISGENDALLLARDIARKLKLSTDYSKFSCESSDGGYTVKIPQIFAGIHVFNYDIVAKISSSGNVIASGQLAGNGKLYSASGDVLATSALMLEFADEAPKRFPDGTRIDSVELGYFAERSASGVISLVPAARIATADGDVYVDATTGEIREI